MISLAAISLISSPCSRLHPAYGLVAIILYFVKDGGSFLWCQTLREGNKVANCLVYYVYSVDAQMVVQGP